MIKSCYALIAFFTVGYAHSQSLTFDNTLEFQVYDSVSIYPEKIIYTVVTGYKGFENDIYSSYDVEEERTNEDEEDLSMSPGAWEQKKESAQLDADKKVKAIMKDLKVVQTNNAPNNIPYYMKRFETIKNTHVYHLEFKSAKDLKQFTDRIGEMEYVFGSITDLKITETQIAKAKEKAYANMAKKAQGEAALLAANFNRTLGKVVSLKVENTNTYANEYEAEAYYPYDMGSQDETKKMLFFTVTVKYELK